MDEHSSPVRGSLRKQGLPARLASALFAGEFRVLLLVAVVAAGIWGFAELADEVREGDTKSFDARLLTALREPGNRADPLGPSWVEEACRDLTALGGTIVLTMLTTFSAGLLLLQHKRREALLLLGAVVSGFVADMVLKGAFHRPRPDPAYYLSQVHSSSFPSGHSMMSAITYLTLGTIMAGVANGKGLKSFLMATAILLTLLVGFSRVYLGVHWPTDVLAGWTCGAVWAALWQLAAHVIRRPVSPRRHGETENGCSE